MRREAGGGNHGVDEGRAGRPRARALVLLALLPLLAFVLWPCSFLGVPPYAAGDAPVVILSSLKIGPYQTLAEAMRENMRDRDVRILYLDETPGAAAQLQGLAPSAIVTVGQEALRQALLRRDHTPLVFTMVLFPQDILPREAPGITGIAMVPSPRQQLLVLHEGLGLRRVTLFYNPAVTDFLVGHFRQLAPPGLQVRAVELSSYSELVAKLPGELEETEGVLLVPDPTVLTEQGLKSLITSCYTAGLPVVGFSPMYLEMGAALTLSVPPGAVARQAVSMAGAQEKESGDLLGRVYYLKSCLIQVNAKAVTKLNLKVNQKALKSLGTLQWSGG
jgi:ABC-type uncharacterized transport system substrate-binding protein